MNECGLFWRLQLVHTCAGPFQSATKYDTFSHSVNERIVVVPDYNQILFLNQIFGVKMLQPIIQQLNAQRIILASGSPRRQEILRNIVSNFDEWEAFQTEALDDFRLTCQGLKVELCPSLFEENLDYKAFPTFGAFVEETALQKVLEVDQRLKETNTNEKAADIIIGADTMVTLDGKMYGKPQDAKTAFETLSTLVGKVNVVYTGVVIKYGEKICRFTESAKVQFGQATPEQIQAYVDTGEPL